MSKTIKKISLTARGGLWGGEPMKLNFTTHDLYIDESLLDLRRVAAGFAEMSRGLGHNHKTVEVIVNADESTTFKITDLEFEREKAA